MSRSEQMTKFMVLERQLASARRRSDSASAASLARSLSAAFDGLDAAEIARLVARRDGERRDKLERGLRDATWDRAPGGGAIG